MHWTSTSRALSIPTLASCPITSVGVFMLLSFAAVSHVGWISQIKTYRKIKNWCFVYSTQMTDFFFSFPSSPAKQLWWAPFAVWTGIYWSQSRSSAGLLHCQIAPLILAGNLHPICETWLETLMFHRFAVRTTLFITVTHLDKIWIQKDVRLISNAFRRLQT